MAKFSMEKMIGAVIGNNIDTVQIINTDLVLFGKRTVTVSYDDKSDLYIATDGQREIRCSKSVLHDAVTRLSVGDI